jgi:hypothetical protein
MDEGSRIYRPWCNLPMHTTTVPCSGRKSQGSAGARSSTRDVRGVMRKCKVLSARGEDTGEGKEEKSPG